MGSKLIGRWIVRLYIWDLRGKRKDLFFQVKFFAIFGRKIARKVKWSQKCMDVISLFQFCSGNDDIFICAWSIISDLLKSLHVHDEFYHFSLLSLKASWYRNVFLVSSILPKNELKKIDLRCHSRGQLNSEWIYEVIVSPKMPTKNYQDFCPGSLLEGRAEIFQFLGWNFGRNDDLINSFWI